MVLYCTQNPPNVWSKICRAPKNVASSASNIPSNHGSNFLAQWSECTKTLEPLGPLEPLEPLEVGEPLGIVGIDGIVTTWNVEEVA